MPATLQARVIALARDGVPPREIEIILERRLQRISISNILVKARRAGADIPRFGRDARPLAPKPAQAETQLVPVSRETFDALVPIAARRKVSVIEIMRRLLEIVAIERFAEAVLDDGE